MIENLVRPGFIRLLLSVLVVLYHLTKFVFIGQSAVYAFFFLSGYWIYFMYEKKYRFLNGGIKAYYISRIWRIYPVFVLFTIGGCILSSIWSDFEYNRFYKDLHFTLSNLFILGYATLEYPILGPAWSLDIELQFYLIFPILYLSINDKNIKRDFIIFSLFVMYSLFVLFFQPKTLLHNILPFYLPFFLTGIYALKYNVYIYGKVTTICFISGFLIICIHLFVPMLREIVKLNNTHYHLIFNYFITLFFLPKILEIQQNKSEGVDKILGDMSFVIYLCHWILLAPYNFILDNYSINRLLLVLLYLVSTVLLSLIVYHYFDRYSENLRNNWLKTQK